MASSTSSMNGNKSITITPRIKTFTVSLGSHPNANVTLSYSGGSATNNSLSNVPYGSTVTVTATANTGYTLGTVSPSNSFVVKSDVTVTVSTNINSFTVTLGTHTGANVTLSYSGGSVTNSNLTGVPYGSTVSVNATAQTGYTVGTISPASSFVITSDTTVTVGASINTYTLTLGSHPNSDVVISGYGSNVTNSSKSGIPYGTNMTVTANPYSGYAVTGLYVS